MTVFFINLLKITAIQLLGILGIFFIFGFALSKLEEWTQRKYFDTVGWHGILWTAWLGTPFHEFGHYFFAKIFRHKILRFRLFEPNRLTGELGSVEHSFNKYSLYQKVGNFFIGAAPIIFGTTTLAFLVYFLLPNGKEVFLPLLDTDGSMWQAFESIKQSLKNLFALPNIKSWSFWLFLYLSFCISSHLAPSRPDRKGMWSGLYYIILILLLINIFGSLLRLDITKYILHTAQYLNIFIAILIYSLVISFAHFLFSYIILSMIKKIQR